MPGGSVRTSTEAIASLGTIVGAIAVVILVGVEIAIVYAIWRYRSSRVGGIPPQITGNTRLEVIWTVLPAITLVVVFVLMIGTMNEIAAAPSSYQGAMPLVVRGHQWWWELRYPQKDGTEVVAANEIHIPVSTEIDVSLQSADVIHSFWVPQLAGKMDLIPGRDNHLRLYASRTGTYFGACAEYCGIEHAWMRLRIVVEPADRFQTWLRGQAASRAAPSGLAQKGEQVFTTALCASCHTVRGSSASGAAGPDLTHLASRTTIGAGVLPNNDASLHDWVADPQRFKPGSFMPLVPLAPDDLNAVIAYLRSLQ
ncbi:MAG: cytochrome c oxidase subunit II [Chloroflexota bacterium]|nr:cytochrome c oxidase subunit II [Chloroflexota bacterium]